MHIAAAQEIVHRLIPALMSALYLKSLGETPGKDKRRRVNKKSALIITDVPELRIIDEDLWERVKERQRGLYNVCRSLELEGSTGRG